MNFLKTIVLFFFFLGILISCERIEYITIGSGNLEVSSDTVTFDTIFTTVGSVTKRFKIYNRHNSKTLKLNSLFLEGGETSNFRINVDGVPGIEYNDLEIMPDDSVFIFVQANLDPVNSNLPMVVEDKVTMLTDDGSKSVILEAFGQDVHLIDGEIIETATWINDKPYLIINSMAVDSFHILTIEEGVRVHLHDNSSMIIWGQLQVSGTFENPVVFEGSRFDRDYGQSAGRWGTIFFHPKSQENILEYAVIKNPEAGIQIGLPGDYPWIPSVELRNCFIQNCSSIGIYAFGAEITAYNTIIADCHYQALAAYMGGKYNFYHCTISNNGSYSPTYLHKYITRGNSSSVVLTNYVEWYTLDKYYNQISTVFNNALEANFYNSIIYGTKKEELSRYDNSNTEFHYQFNHCILKATEDSVDLQDTDHFYKVYLNEYPKFINDSLTNGDYDFRLDTLSPAKDSGNLQIVLDNSLLEYDYKGNSRLDDEMPDLGAFERVE